MSQSLIIKYRPESWDNLIGHEEIVTILRRALNSPAKPHAYLLTGPSGVGKTTIARIIAKELGAEVAEVDAASNSGVEAMRSLMEIAGYIPMGKIKKKLLIIDEAHRLSRAAFEAALKIIEEPPEHLYFAFCTTELAKVPETIQTRCFPVPLKPLRANDIGLILDLTCELEGWTVKPEVLQAVIQAATGQPRKALTILQAVHSVDNAEEVSRIVTLINDDDNILRLARLLLERAPWERLLPVVQKVLEADDIGQSAIGIGRYFGAVMTREGVSEEQARKAWTILDALVYPSHSWDSRTTFLAAIGRILWSE